MQWLAEAFGKQRRSDALDANGQPRNGLGVTALLVLDGILKGFARRKAVWPITW